MRAVARQATLAVTTGARAGGASAATQLRTRHTKGAPVSSERIAPLGRLVSDTARMLTETLGGNVA